MPSSRVIPITVPRQSTTSTPRSGASVSVVAVVDPGSGDFLFGEPLTIPMPSVPGTFDFFSWGVNFAGSSDGTPDFSGAQGSYMLFLSPDSDPDIEPPIGVYAASVTQSGTTLTLRAGPVLVPSPEEVNPRFFASSQHPDGVAAMGIITGTSPVLGDSYIRAIDADCNMGPATLVGTQADNEYLIRMLAFAGSNYGIAYINGLAPTSHIFAGRIVLYRVNSDLTVTWNLDSIAVSGPSNIVPLFVEWVPLSGETMLVGALNAFSVDGFILVTRSGDSISATDMATGGFSGFETGTAIDATHFVGQEGSGFAFYTVIPDGGGGLDVTSSFIGEDAPGSLAGPTNGTYFVIVDTNTTVSPHILTFSRRDYSFSNLGGTVYDNRGSTNDFPKYGYDMNNGNMIISRFGESIFYGPAQATATTTRVADTSTRVAIAMPRESVSAV